MAAGRPPTRRNGARGARLAGCGFWAPRVRPPQPQRPSSRSPRTTHSDIGDMKPALARARRNALATAWCARQTPRVRRASAMRPTSDRDVSRFARALACRNDAASGRTPDPFDGRRPGPRRARWLRLAMQFRRRSPCSHVFPTRQIEAQITRPSSTSERPCRAKKPCKSSTHNPFDAGSSPARPIRRCSRISIIFEPVYGPRSTFAFPLGPRMCAVQAIDSRPTSRGARSGRPKSQRRRADERPAAR